MKESRTSRAVLYEALDQAIRPFAEAIEKEFDMIYNCDCVKDPDVNLSDLLEWAMDVAYEEEVCDGSRKKAE